MPTSDHKLTRADMERVISRNGSVLLPGPRIVTSIDHLPSEAELAQGDADRSKAVADALERQIQELTAQRSLVLAPADTAPPVKAGKKSDAPADQGQGAPPADDAPADQGAK